MAICPTRLSNSLSRERIFICTKYESDIKNSGKQSAGEIFRSADVVVTHKI